MDSTYRNVDIWIAKFPSKKSFDSYLADSANVAEDIASSRFAADQDKLFVDHYLIEAAFHAKSLDFRKHLAEHSFAAS